MLVYCNVLNMTNIPFKDCFTVNTCWVVRPGADANSCSFSAHLKVREPTDITGRANYWGVLMSEFWQEELPFSGGSGYFNPTSLMTPPGDSDR